MAEEEELSSVSSPSASEGFHSLHVVVRPSRNDIRASATRFAHEWSDETRERGEAQTFWTEFLQVFGVDRRRANAAFERQAQRLSTGGAGFIDLLWPGMLLAEHKSRGADLDTAMAQALDYIDGLSAKELPRLVIASDFGRLRVLDLDAPDRTPSEFELVALPDEIDRFLSLAGYRSRRFETEDAVNVEAAELLGRVYDEIAATGFPPHALRVLVVRLLFLLFADDTGLWQRNQFADLVRDRTSEDGTDLGMWLNRLFSVLNTPAESRSSVLDEELDAFPYANGGLFAEDLDVSDTTRSMRDRLLEASSFDWSQISPAIFGSMFQSVMDPAARRSLGAHYTSEPNILKLIRPLFLDALESELDECGSSKIRLQRFHTKLASLRLFDPACGCGNFLVIAYRELRRLERETLQRLFPDEVQMTTDLENWRKVKPSQFFGIEIEEFPARIAETAMYLIDHLENEALGRQFGVNFPELPLAAGAHIHVANALRIDWDEVLPASDCTYLLGNPPYAGKHLLDADQREDLAGVFSSHGLGASLDYVSGWLVRAAEYLQAGPSIQGAFVTTNSITQGEQVPALWPTVHSLGLHIRFGWRTFNWKSEGRGAAHVHVVIIGFDSGKSNRKTELFEWEVGSETSIARTVRTLNGYLAPGPEIYPASRSQPLDPDIPTVVYGAKPADGGHLLLTSEEAAEIRASDPVAAAYIRPLMSATEFLNGRERFCLWLVDASPADIRRSPELTKRLAEVRAFREKSSKKQTREAAELPGLFAELRKADASFIFVPRHASASRRLIPMGFVSSESSAIVHDSGAYIESDDLALFGILQSEMFAAWQRTVGGRIKSDYRFNNKLVYNTFPFPTLSVTHRTRIAECGNDVLIARASHPESSLADLYAADAGPRDLIHAHRALDSAVDSAFGRRSHLTEADRLGVLFSRYVELSTGEVIEQESFAV